MALSFGTRRRIVTAERLAKKAANVAVKGVLPTIAGVTAAQELIKPEDIPTAALVAGPVIAATADRIRRIRPKPGPKPPIKEEKMKIRQALIKLSENKLEEMSNNLRQALTQKAAETLEEKKAEMANKFFNDK